MNKPSHRDVKEALEKQRAVKVTQYQDKFLGTIGEFKNPGFGPPILLKFYRGKTQVGLYLSSNSGASYFSKKDLESFLGLLERVAMISRIINNEKREEDVEIHSEKI